MYAVCAVLHRFCGVLMRSFRFGGGIGTIDFANLGGQLSSLSWQSEERW